ncbi:MAG: DUF2357 domain-containing protein [Chloroflexaceae bacterium]|nr:DUF2357 domain-containing protein [Chloroflexaceae bacterium]
MTLEIWINQQPAATTATIKEWQTLECQCVPPAGYQLSLTLHGVGVQIELRPFLAPGDPTWYWRWNPHNMVGWFQLTLRASAAEQPVLQRVIKLEVHPDHIDPERYHQLIDDLQRCAWGLITTLSGPASRSRSAPDDQPQPSLAHWFALLQRNTETLEQALQRIARRPHSQPRPVTQRIAIEHARDLSRLHHDLGRTPIVPHPASAAGALPASVTARVPLETNATRANAMVRQTLDAYWQRARFLAAQAIREAERSSGRHALSAQMIAQQSQTMTARLAQLRELPFLPPSVQPFHATQPDQIIQHDHDYQLIYRCWHELRHTPWIDMTSQLAGPALHQLPRLYEMWCLFQVVQALLELPDSKVVQQQTMVSSDGSYLRHHEPFLQMQWHGLQLRLRYQPRYQPDADPPLASLVALDCHTHIPDIALEITAPASDTPLVLIADAKYRLDRSGGLPRDALADAYTYLGSIGTAQGQRAVIGVALLYPGDAAAEHYASGIALLPLWPGHTADLSTWLHTNISTTWPEASTPSP